MKKFCTILMLTYPREYTVRVNQDFMTLFTLGMGGGNMKRALFISVLMLFLLIPTNVEAQGAPIGVEVDCDQSTININVHPEQNEPVSVPCTVKNTGSFAQDISLESEVGGNDFSLTLSEDSFEQIAAGEEMSFTAVFAASPRIAVITEDFTITGRVTSWGMEPVMVPWGQMNSTGQIAGTVNSLPYSRMDLEVSNPSARNIEVGEEAAIQFTIFNDGNRIDNLEVEIVNLQELEDAGFKFVSDPFFRATVNPGSSSDQGDIIMQAPDESSSEISVQVELRAFSKLDLDAEASEVSIRVNVAASSGGGGSIGLDDISSMSEDSVAIIAMGAGGLIAVIFLLVIISRLTKKAGKQKIAAKEAKRVAKAEKKANKANRKAMKKSGASKKKIVEEFDGDLDFDDLDDLDDEFDFEDI